MINILAAGVVGGGEAGAGAPPPPPPPLTAPSNLNATDNSTCPGCSLGYSVSLTWTTGEPTAQTKIYRNGVLIHTNSAGDNTYTDTGGSSEGSVSYSVRHYLDGQYSPLDSDSVVVSACEDSLSAPSVSASMVSSSAIDVVPSGGGTDVDSYDIHLSDGTYLGNVGTGSTYHHTGLDAGTQYTYKAKARSATDCLSGYGSTDSAYTQLATPSGASVAVGPTSIECYCPGGIPANATGVEVYRNDSVLVGTITSAPTPVTDTGLDADTLYTYYYYAVGTAPDSDADTDAETTQDGVPTGLSAVHDDTDCADSYGTVDLTWSCGDNDASQVKVERKEPGEGSYSTLATLAAGTTAYSDEYADPSGSGTTYYRVSFVFTGSSQYDTDQLTVSCLPDPPFGSDVSMSGSDATIIWNDQATIPNESGFKVYRAPDSGGVPGSWSLIDTVGSGVETTDDLGVPIGWWHYAVSSYNSWGETSKNECLNNPVYSDGMEA